MQGIAERVTVGVEVEIGVEIFIIDFKCIDYLS